MAKITKRLRSFAANMVTSLQQIMLEHVLSVFPNTLLPLIHHINRKESEDDSDEDLSWRGYFFRGQILDQLDYYFWCINRIKHSDPQAFGLYKNTGALLLPHDDTTGFMVTDKLSPSFKKDRPSFGAVAWAIGVESEKSDREIKKMSPRFMWFKKFDIAKAPIRVQKVNCGDIYTCNVYWDDHDMESGKSGWKPRRTGFQVEYAVAVTPEGDIKVLRIRSEDHVTIKHKHRKEDADWRGRYSQFTRQVWSIPKAFHEWAAEHNRTAVDHLRIMFATTMAMIEQAQSEMVRIDVEKNGVHAAFTVNVKRTPYFFKDRDTTVNINGAKRRIFHVVRPHTRTSGSVVRMHFRGERKFMWNGYNINITVPGWHHPDIREFDAAALSFDDGEPIPTGLMSESQTGRWIRKHILSEKRA